MAIAGGAIIPVVYGKVSEVLGSLQEGYVIALACYGIIFMYGIRWHRTQL
jgi:fucose permease